MKKWITFLFTVLICNTLVYSQAGLGVYSFLDLPSSSRLAALGGNNVSIQDNDINFAFCNPALLSASSDKNLGLNYTGYFAGIGFGSVIYGMKLNDKNVIAAGINYVDYGQFKEATEYNQILGNFTASDYAVNLMYAHTINQKLTVGAILKPVYSHYADYSSFGLAADAGISFADSASLWNIGLVFKNMGSQIKAYYSTDGSQHYEPLPFNIQFGLSKKFAHAPFRISMTFNNLQKWDLTYQQGGDQMLEDNNPVKISFGSMFMRHAIFAVDILPSNSIYLTVAYNGRRAAELAIDNVRSMAGFSFGAGIKILKIHAGFGLAQYMVGNYTYHFSLSTNLGDFGL